MITPYCHFPQWTHINNIPNKLSGQNIFDMDTSHVWATTSPISETKVLEVQT